MICNDQQEYGDSKHVREEAEISVVNHLHGRTPECTINGLEHILIYDQCKSAAGAAYLSARQQQPSAGYPLKSPRGDTRRPTNLQLSLICCGVLERDVKL